MTDLDRWAPTFRIWLYLSAGLTLFVLTLLIVLAAARAVVVVRKLKSQRSEEKI